MPAAGTGPTGVWGSQCHSRVHRAVTQATNQMSFFVFGISAGRRERGDRGASAAGPPPSTAELQLVQLQRLPLELEMALVRSARGFASSKG